MSTDTDIQHLKAKLEHRQAQLTTGEITEKSFGEYRSRIRGEAKKAGIDPDLVAPLDGKAEKKIEAKPETVAPSITPSTVKRIPVAEICVDSEIQQRASHVDAGLRAEYAEAMHAGASFPPVVVFDADRFWLADGFHRVGAAEDAGLTEIRAEIRQGDRRDALLYAVGANAEHGARRTNADKTRAVETLLADPEWSMKSDRWIADTANVSPTFVGGVRESLTVKPTVHVDSDLGEAPAPETPPAPVVRQTKDGRAMNVANIGKKRSKAPWSRPKPKPKPKAPTAANAQQAMHRFMAACVDLHRVANKLTGHEIFQIAQRARDTLIDSLPRLKEQDRATMLEKVRSAIGEPGHA